ncbi:MAG: hypothetical protein NE327_08785 [Lentisphaeraceae bacterium]|nr:hypothetical protein [Lentisphaeraceae bacterium]
MKVFKGILAALTVGSVVMLTSCASDCCGKCGDKEAAKCAADCKKACCAKK